MPAGAANACPLCSIELRNWSSSRKSLHLRACLERTVSECRSCPACLKDIHGSVSRAHLISCAAKLSITLIQLMSLSEIRPKPSLTIAELKPYASSNVTSSIDDDLQTAVALSLSFAEEENRRASEAVMSNRIHISDICPPTHLLLSGKQRQSIFFNRLESLLLSVRRPDVKRCPHDNSLIRSGSVPCLWNLATTHSSVDGFTDDDQLRFYVSALVPPLSPTRTTWGSNLHSLSQIPGRNTLKQIDSPIPDVTQQERKYNDDCKLICFSSMVGNNLCSDASLLLDNGALFPVHRFIFAAWGILDNVFKVDSSVSSAAELKELQLRDFLHLLYAGDRENFNRQLEISDDAIVRLAARWGLLSPNPVMSIDAKSSPGPAIAVDKPVNIHSNESCHNGQLVGDANPSDCTQTIGGATIEYRQQHFPTTPEPSPTKDGEKVPFSRDLFASPSPEIIDLTDSPAVALQVPGPLKEAISPLPGEITGSPLSLSPPRNDLDFPTQPTPFPLHKRIRLSTTTITGVAAAPIVSDRKHASEIAMPVPTSISPVPLLSCSPPVTPGGDMPAWSPLDTSPVAKSTVDHLPLAMDQGDVVLNRTPGSPQDSGGDDLLMATPVTPMPNYMGMMTPELKRALCTYGVRPLPRKKAVLLLREIYNQLHQYEPSTPSKSSCQRANNLERPVPVLTTEVSSMKSSSRPMKQANREHFRSTHDVSDEEPDAFNPFEVAGDPDQPDDQQVESSKGNVRCSVIDYLKGNEDLYSAILTYEPLEFDAIHAQLKSAGIPISARILMDIFDEQCITFTLRNKHNRGGQRRTWSRPIRGRKKRADS